MRILKMVPPVRGGPDMVAEFILEFVPEMRLCNLRLLKTPTGYNVHFPNVSGGGRSVSVSLELRAQIIETAKNYYEGLNIGQDTIRDRSAA